MPLTSTTSFFALSLFPCSFPSFFCYLYLSFYPLPLFIDLIGSVIFSSFLLYFLFVALISLLMYNLHVDTCSFVLTSVSLYINFAFRFMFLFYFLTLVCSFCIWILSFILSFFDWIYFIPCSFCLHFFLMSFLYLFYFILLGWISNVLPFQWIYMFALCLLQRLHFLGVRCSVSTDKLLCILVFVLTTYLPFQTVWTLSFSFTICVFYLLVDVSYCLFLFSVLGLFAIPFRFYWYLRCSAF